MTTRRDFIGAAGAMAGAAFVGCDLLAPTHVHAQGAPARRREVVVNGRRVKTVDVHAHCAFPQAMAWMKVNPDNLVMGADRIRAMDEQGIDIEALSINPYWYKAERDVAQAVIKMQNENSRSCAPPSPIVSSPSRRSRCSTRISPSGSSKRASRRSDCAGSPSAATSRAASSPIRRFIRSGPKRRSSAA
jgi:hypothetical protein